MKEWVIALYSFPYEMGFRGEALSIADNAGEDRSRIRDERGYLGDVQKF